MIAGLARAAKADILRAAEAIAPAARPRIHTFIGTSPLHREFQLRMDQDQVLAAIADSVTLARRHSDDVEWSAMDATRTEPDFLCRCVEAAIRAGATTINLPDTVGYALPADMATMFADVRARVPGADGVIFSAHNHDDLGLAVANTIAAIGAGVRQVECTINGIGERAGNAALEEIAMALRCRADEVGVRTGIVTEHLLRTSRLLATITGFDVQPNKAIVGRNAFAHESGIHQDGVLKNAATYEIMTPESVGWQRSNLVMGKHSGRAAFRDKLRTLGYGEIGDNQLQDAFRRFKDLADRKKVVYDDDIVALVDDEVLRDHERVRFLAMELRTGTGIKPHASMELEVDGERRRAELDGDGAVDATFNAIREIVSHTATLKTYFVSALTDGTDAQARVTVRLEEDGKLVDGQGADPDTIVSSARAYIHALNKLMAKRARTAPEALGLAS